MCSVSYPRRPRSIIRRGVSIAIAAAVIFPVFLLLVFWAMSQISIATQASIARISVEAYKQMELSEDIRGTISVSGSRVVTTFKNYGPSTSFLTELYVDAKTVSGSELKFVVDLTRSGSSATIFNNYANISITPKTSWIEGVGVAIDPGSVVSITIDFSDDISKASVVAMTSKGKIVTTREQTSSTQAQGVAATLIFFTVPTITDLMSRSDIYVSPPLLSPASPDDPGTGVTGGNGYSGVYCLIAKYTDVKISGTVYFTTAYIGFDASWTQTRSGTPRYTMMLVTTKLWGGSLWIGDEQYRFSKYKAYRVVIYGFRGDISVKYVHYNPTTGQWEIDRKSNSIAPEDVIGIYLYGQLYGYYYGYRSSYVYLSGSANEVLVYARSSLCGSSSEVSYTPYLILGDFDNNGLPEMLFTTEDAMFDVDRDWVGNDIDTTRYSYTSYDLNDYSTEPLRIVFTGYPIDSNKYVAVQIAFRYYFHDNAGGDEEEIDTNAWIVRFALIDTQTGEEASWYELRYQTLTRYEDTYPPSWDYRIDTILLMVPQTGHTYYLVVEFRDPYPAYASIDDADIMMGIEYLSITFMYQP